MSEDQIKSLLPECLLRSETYYLIITDLEGRYIFANDVFKRRFSFISENFIGQLSLNSIYPNDHDRCLQAVNQCLANPEKVVKLHLRKPDTTLNDFYWTEWEFSIFKDSAQNQLGILCLGHDITEMQRANHQAKEFAQKVDTIIEEIMDGFYQLDREWKFTKINQVAEQVLGVSREQILGHNFWDIFPDTTDFNYPAAYRKAMNEYLTVTFEDYRADIDRWFSVVCYPSKEGLSIFFRDNTQEKKNQEKLKYSEEKLRAILNSTSESNILISPKYKILSFNKIAQENAIQYFNKPMQIGADFYEYLTQEGKEVFDSYFPRALEGETLSLEVQRKIDNENIWFKVSYHPAYDDDDRLLGVTLNTININARKQAEEELKNKANKLRSILESTTDGNILIATNFQILSFNKTIQQDIFNFFGLNIKYGDDFRKYFDAENKEVFLTNFQKALNGEVVVFEAEYKIKEQKIWYFVRFFPAYDEKGKIFGVTYNYKNIQNRKTAELKLRQSETMLKAVYDSSREAITFIDPNLYIVFNNKLAREITKNIFGKEAQPGDKSLDYYLPDLQAEFLKYYQRVLQGETIYVEKEHNSLWWAFSLFPVFDGENHIVGIADNVQDITVRKKNELKILKQNEALNQIAWQQSHEVRRPVANIMGMYNLIKNDKGVSPEEKQEYLDFLFQATEELDKIIHKIVAQSNENEYLNED